MRLAFRGGLVGTGLVGRAPGVGNGELLVRCSAVPVQAPRLVSSASLRAWRVRPPYWSGSCPCASARALPGRGAAGLVLRWATAGRGGQVWRLGTPGEGPVTGLQVCVLRLTEATREVGG